MPSKRRTPPLRPAGRPATVRRARTPEAREQERGPGGGSKLTGRAAVLFLVMLVLLISYASSLRAWLQQRDDTAQAQADVAAAKQEIAALEEERDRLNDPAYIEKEARERFGWLMPGETGYTTLTEDGDVLGSTGALSEPTSATSEDDAEWYGKVWGSVQSAGAEPPDEAAEDADQPAERPEKKDIVRPEGGRR